MATALRSRLGGTAAITPCVTHSRTIDAEEALAMMTRD
jgi:hypothetical protein